MLSTSGFGSGLAPSTARPLPKPEVDNITQPPTRYTLHLLTATPAACRGFPAALAYVAGKLSESRQGAIPICHSLGASTAQHLTPSPGGNPAAQSTRPPPRVPLPHPNPLPPAYTI